MNRKATPALHPDRRVYSYVRFSTPGQASGSSRARQQGYAEKWAREHGLMLDDSLTMFDAGKSAYHGRHVKQCGALHEFLKRIEDGRVAPGSVLVLEAWDRFSRQTPMAAFRLLSEIIERDVSVVTTGNGKIWNRETMTKDEWALLEVIVDMSRAHRESSRKSGLIKDAIRDKCRRWLGGTYKGRVGGAQTDPGWVVWNADRQRFELDEGRAQAMRRMVELYRAGYGAIRIIEMLADEGLRISETHGVNRVRQLINQPTLMGTKVVKIDNETFELRDYFPAILSPEVFEELQHLQSKRGIRKGKGEIPALLTGMQRTYCGYCGSLISTQNLRRARKAAGGSDAPAFQRRLRCNRKFFYNEHCIGGDSVMAEPIEVALLAYCSDQFNLDALLAQPQDTDAVTRALVAARAGLAKTEKKLAGIERALQSDDDVQPEVFTRIARELEAKKREQQHDVEKLEREAGVQARAKPSSAHAWAKLKKGVLALDYDARMRARHLVMDTFEKINIFMSGLHADQADVIRLRLTSKSGVVREVELNRLTGELIDSDEIALENLRIAKKPARKPRRKSVTT